MFATGLVKTGEECPIGGNYVLEFYTDGSRFPPATIGEGVIYIPTGHRVPPVRSVCKGAYRRRI